MNWSRRSEVTIAEVTAVVVVVVVFVWIHLGFNLIYMSTLFTPEITTLPGLTFYSHPARTQTDRMIRSMLRIHPVTVDS